MGFLYLIGIIAACTMTYKGWLILFGIIVFSIVWEITKNVIVNINTSKDFENFESNNELTEITSITKSFVSRQVDCPICGYKMTTSNGKVVLACEHYPI